MENEKNYLPSNIKVLREERRLSIEEFAALAGVSVDTVIGWEKGTIKVYTKDLIVICPILRISEEDIRERDIRQERLEAYDRMKHGSSRKNFDWYYGSKAKVIYYLLPIILIPLAALLGYLVSLQMADYYQELNKLWAEAGNSAPNYLYEYYSIVYPIIAGCGCALIFMIIEVIKRFRQYLKWWYIMLAISFFSVLFVVACVATIPFYIYCFYQVFVLKGKNRK